MEFPIYGVHVSTQKLLRAFGDSALEIPSQDNKGVC